MKTRGIVNATRRLIGARKLGSNALTAKAEEEARHILTQALVWIERSKEKPAADQAAEDNRRSIAEAVQILRKTLLEEAAGH